MSSTAKRTAKLEAVAGAIDKLLGGTG